MSQLIKINELQQKLTDLADADWIVVDVADVNEPSGFKTMKLNKTQLGIPRQEDRLKTDTNVGHIYDLDFSQYEMHDLTLVNTPTTFTISNPIPKTVVVTATGGHVVSFPAGALVVGDVYNGTKINTITIHYVSASKILIIVTNF